MRTRVVTLITVTILVAPFLSAAANASPPEHNCPARVAVEHKCK
jgi:hypothetical protein